MAKKLNALVPYYGCKRQMANRIVAQLDEHAVYVEPFCGSMAVLLAKEPVRMEIANDLNGALVNLARVVQDDERSVQLFERLNRTAFCEDLYANSVEYLWWRHHDEENFHEASPSLEWAYSYFVLSWMGRNGQAGTANELKTGFCKRYTGNGGDPATRFRNVVANLPDWWQRLRNVTILSEDGIALCRRIEDKDGIAIYVDPPYLDKQAKYAIDFEPAQHEELAETLRRFKQTRVVVSYYDHPLLTDLYLKHGWSLVPVDVSKNLSVAGGAKKAPEVLLINQADAAVEAA